MRRLGAEEMEDQPVNRRMRLGFTLVELLVVIGIVAVLIAIFLPALGKARKHALEVKCAANLRSVGQGLTMYTQWYGYYPGCMIFDGGAGFQAVWPIRLRPFVGGDQRVFDCPARDERFEWRKVPLEPGRAGRATASHACYGYEVGEPLLNFMASEFSYGYNAWGTDVAATTPRGLGWQVDLVPEYGKIYTYGREPPTSRVRSPSEMVAIADSDGDHVYDFVITPFFYAGSARNQIPGNVHRGGANVLFCDGHVQWYAQKDLITHESVVPAEEPIRRMWNRDHQP